MNWELIFILCTEVFAIAALVLAWLAKRDVNNLRDDVHDNLEKVRKAIEHNNTEIAGQLQNVNRKIAELEHEKPGRSATHTATIDSDVTIVEAAPAATSPAFKAATLYLTKPDRKGFFTRAATQFEPGNSIFVLHTDDGVNGTFQVIDDTNVHHTALMMPTENLTGACEGNNIQVSAGMTRIVGEKEGKAVKENGQWRIVKKAKIRYEA